MRCFCIIFTLCFLLNSVVFASSRQGPAVSENRLAHIKITFPSPETIKKKWADRKASLEQELREGRIQDPNGNIRRWIDYVESTDALVRFDQSMDVQAFFLKNILIRSDYIKNIKQVTHHWHDDLQDKGNYQSDVRFAVFDYYFNHSKRTHNWSHRDSLHHDATFVVSNVLDQEANEMADNLVNFLIEEQPRETRKILSDVAYDYFIRGDEFDRALKKASQGHLIID